MWFTQWSVLYKLLKFVLSHSEAEKITFVPRALVCKQDSIFLFPVDHLLCHHEDDTKALLIILKVRNVFFSRW